MSKEAEKRWVKTDVEVPILADFVRAIEAKLKEKNT